MYPDDDWMSLGRCVGAPQRDRRGRVPADGAYEADTARAIHFCEDRKDAVSRLLTLEAKRMCEECEVRAQCLEYALMAKIDHGIWGGTSPKERKAMLRAMPVAS